jgi:signal transduction histidine kinase
MISDDPVATSALIEVVREAVGNSIRHGNATSIVVTIVLRETNLIGLIIADNGSGIAVTAVPGIGSQLFSSLTYDWTIETSPAGTVITADLTWFPST